MKTDLSTAVPTEVHRLKEYLHTVLGVAVITKPWPQSDRLPHFLRVRYSFAEAKLLGVPLLLAVDTQPEQQPLAVVRKHMDLLQARQGAGVVYVRAAITAYNRRRLVDHKIPFIVPGNQMYLPPLAIDLREHFRTLCSKPQVLSPASQLALIYALHQSDGHAFNPLALARSLGYSAMTMTRVFDELQAAELGHVTKSGRERCLLFAGDRQGVWNKAQPLLRSPVRHRFFIRRAGKLRDGFEAGPTALARHSMLAPPSQAAYAFSHQDWRLLRERRGTVVVPQPEPDTCEIEVWAYPPGILTTSGVVDRLSLYLSLKNSHDERVEAALEEMIARFKW